MKWYTYGDPLAVPIRPSAEQRFWAKVTKTDTCWLWTGATNGTGYGRFSRDRQSLVSVHRFSYELQVGPVPAGMCVLHRCDVRNCVRPDHLFLGTVADNNQDMIAKGRGSTGQRNGAAKLTDQQVREIRAAHRQGVPGRSLAKRYGCSEQNISAVVLRKLWKHVQDEGASS
jgi:hypothetical protein